MDEERKINIIDGWGEGDQLQEMNEEEEIDVKDG